MNAGSTSMSVTRRCPRSKLPIELCRRFFLRGDSSASTLRRVNGVVEKGKGMRHFEGLAIMLLVPVRLLLWRLITLKSRREGRCPDFLRFSLLLVPELSFGLGEM